ncbi:putative electron transport protein [Escherichia coli]|nr:putative electron transport protein [Escherichia coli]
MPAQAIHYFMLSPYSVVMDVKMLDFFRHMGDRDINQRDRFADCQPVYSPCLVSLSLPIWRADGRGFAIIAV